MGAVVKSKVGELEEEVSEVFLSWSRKEFTDVVQRVSEKKILLERLHDGYEKDITLNQLTVVTVEKRLTE